MFIDKINHYSTITLNSEISLTYKNTDLKYCKYIVAVFQNFNNNFRLK